MNPLTEPTVLDSPVQERRVVLGQVIMAAIHNIAEQLNEQDANALLIAWHDYLNALEVQESVEELIGKDAEK